VFEVTPEKHFNLDSWLNHHDCHLIQAPSADKIVLGISRIQAIETQRNIYRGFRMELIDLISKNLGVTEEQARTGAGLILKRAKDSLGVTEFAIISSKAPDLEIIVRDTPATDNTVVGEVEKMFSIFGRKMGNLGSAAGVRAGFFKAGLKAELIEKFEKTILTFVQNKAGDSARISLEKGIAAE
jgi:hypothetical protein